MSLDLFESLSLRTTGTQGREQFLSRIEGLPLQISEGVKIKHPSDTLTPALWPEVKDCRTGTPLLAVH